MAISELRILSVKDLMIMLECSERTAYRIKKDIQQHYNVKLILYKHFESYFNLPKSSQNKQLTT